MRQTARLPTPVASPQGTVLRAMIYADGDGAYQ